MTKQKSILVATIGTRDLAFQISETEWLNVGNDRDVSGMSEQAIVLDHLNLSKCTFRELTNYLKTKWEIYQNKLQPIIIGQLLQDEQRNIEKIYLIGTDQKTSVGESEKDTIYATEIIKLWLNKYFNLSTQVITQGNKGENPSNFEEMFIWWKKFWRQLNNENENLEDKKILLCLKGGVNQSSEAARISALNYFGENTYFYDFFRDEKRNFLGKPSRYTSPLKGTNYLWDRQQAEALSFLERWDYQAVQKILRPYWKNSDDREILKIQSKLEKAVAWNIADFQTFSQNINDTRINNWWWPAYEAAYLGVIRFQQDNTVEAMFHTFRAVEGLMTEWIIQRYPSHIEQKDNKSPRLKRSVSQDLSFPESTNLLRLFNGSSELYLYGVKLDEILKIAKPDIKHNYDWLSFFKTTREWRNQAFHRLIKLNKEDVFQAWQASNQPRWENRILGCLNTLSIQQFTSLSNASLMNKLHYEISDLIKSYHP